MMLEFFDTSPDIAVDEFEYKRLLGFPRDFVIEGRALELVDWVSQWYADYGSPWIYAVQSDELEISGGRLSVADAEFSSAMLRQQLTDAGAGSAILVAVSAGPECEAKARELWQAGKPDEYFFLEVYGSAVVEHLITATGARLCAWAEESGSAILPHYSPGYPGWDVLDQRPLWTLLNERRGERGLYEITVMQTGMLRPKKSLLALFGVTAHVDRVVELRSLNPCENCSFTPCQFRRAPYRSARRQIEDVHMLQGKPAANKREAILERDADYNVSVRALRKWSKERLKLTFLESGEIRASFLYEGTTCSNLGHALAYEYRIKLGAPESNYKIQELACEPAPGDDGHQLMCEYLRDSEALIMEMEKEKPLLGRPLNDVLSWRRQVNPVTCFCDSDSREHKWGLVLEVLHYALANNTLQTTI